MKRLYAGKFLAKNTFPLLNGREFTREKNKIDGLITSAIKSNLLKIIENDEIDVISFCRWANRKTKKSKLKWPWLEHCIKLPPEPNSYSGVMVSFEQEVIPADIKECQNLLVEAWRELTDKQKEINELTKEVEMLRVKRQERVANGKKAAAKQWENK